MKGFVTIGLSLYQMDEISCEEMDALLAKGGDPHGGPLQFDAKRRVWPKPREQDVVTFYE